MLGSCLRHSTSIERIRSAVGAKPNQPSSGLRLVHFKKAWVSASVFVSVLSYLLEYLLSNTASLVKESRMLGSKFYGLRGQKLNFAIVVIAGMDFLL